MLKPTHRNVRDVWDTRQAAAKLHQIRVIDESGENYIYPEEYFVALHLPQATEKAVRRASAGRG